MRIIFNYYFSRFLPLLFIVMKFGSFQVLSYTVKICWSSSKLSLLSCVINLPSFVHIKISFIFIGSPAHSSLAILWMSYYVNFAHLSFYFPCMYKCSEWRNINFLRMCAVYYSFFFDYFLFRQIHCLEEGEVIWTLWEGELIHFFQMKFPIWLLRKFLEPSCSTVIRHFKQKEKNSKILDSWLFVYSRSHDNAFVRISFFVIVGYLGGRFSKDRKHVFEFGCLLTGWKCL